MRIEMGACQSCPAPAELNSVTCHDCGRTPERLCKNCQQGCCPECGGPLGKTSTVFPYSLFAAIQKGYLDTTRDLICTHEPNLRRLQDTNGDTVLHAASRIETQEAALTMCELLIELGAPIRPTRNPYGRTPLIEIVHYRTYHKKVAALFSGTVNEQDDEGRTALMFAAKGHGSMASRRGNIAIAKHLIELGADVSLRDRTGRTALSIAKAANDTDNNNEMIAFLEARLVEEAAMRMFRQDYTCEFDRYGVLQIARTANA